MRYLHDISSRKGGPFFWIPYVLPLDKNIVFHKACVTLPLHYRCITVTLPLHYRCITVNRTSSTISVGCNPM